MHEDRKGRLLPLGYIVHECLCMNTGREGCYHRGTLYVNVYRKGRLLPLGYIVQNTGREGCYHWGALYMNASALTQELAVFHLEGGGGALGYPPSPNKILKVIIILTVV